MQSLILSLIHVLILIITIVVVLYSTPEEIKRGVKFDLAFANNNNWGKAGILYAISITVLFSIVFIFLTILFHDKTWRILPEYWALYPIALTIGVVVILWRVLAAFRPSSK